MKKIDTHCHSLSVSACSHIPAARISEVHHNAGIDMYVLTNHYNHIVNFGENKNDRIEGFLADFHMAREMGKKIGVTAMLGAEVFFWQRYIENGEEKTKHADFLLYGITESFIRKHYPLYELSQKELFELCCSENVIMIQAHPFRIEQKHQPFDLKYMHGMELYNGHPHFSPGTEQVKELTKDIDGFYYTGGTDMHIKEQAGTAGMYVPDEVECIEDLCFAIRNGQTKIFPLAAE